MATWNANMYQPKGHIRDYSSAQYGHVEAIETHLSQRMPGTLGLQIERYVIWNLEIMVLGL